ncbi:MAG: choice-of-anchor B family protein [Bacteroidia bacterium]
MFKQLAVCICICISSSPLFAQVQAYKIQKLAQYNNPDLPKVDGTDIWNDITGWHDSTNGREYIICGTTDSIYFFDISIPTQMKLVQVKSGKSSFVRNRDYETYSHYAYCVSDQGFGDGQLQIFDLSYLPDSVHEVYSSNVLGKFTHTISIDPESKRLYMCMNSKPSGFSAMDILGLNNPEQPELLAKLEVPSKPNGNPIFNKVHEMYARHDTVYLSCEEAGLFIFDLTNLNNQKLLTSITSYPDQGYNHSSWLDESGRYLMFTDENMGLDIKIFDLKNFSEPQFVSQFNSNQLAMPHNAIWVGDFAYVSSYHDGVRIYNIKDPSNPQMAAWYDTHFEVPEVYGGYKGCWGIYPFLPSKLVLASDLTNGIFVLQVDSDLVGNSEVESNSNGFTIYPNPVKESFMIQSGIQNQGEIKIEIMNPLGEKELELTQPIEQVVQVPTLKPGIHFIVIYQGNKRSIKKLIKSE